MPQENPLTALALDRAWAALDTCGTIAAARKLAPLADAGPGAPADDLAALKRTTTGSRGMPGQVGEPGGVEGLQGERSLPGWGRGHPEAGSNAARPRKCCSRLRRCRGPGARDRAPRAARACRPSRRLPQRGTPRGLLPPSARNLLRVCRVTRGAYQGAERPTKSKRARRVHLAPDAAQVLREQLLARPPGSPYCSRTVTSAHVGIACGICGLRCCRSPARALSSRGRPESRLPGTALRGGEDLRPGQRLPALRAQRGRPDVLRPKRQAPPGPSPAHLPGLGEAGRESFLFCHNGVGGSRPRNGARP